MTVDQILQGAAQVFAERGHGGSTTNLIAKRTGISIGSLYQYFPNKEAILVELLRRHVQETNELISGIIHQALTDKRPLDLLLAELVQAVLDLHLASPGLMRVLLNDAPRPDDIAESMHRDEDELADLVQTLLAQHAALQPRHAAHAAYFLVHLLEGLCHEFALHPPRSMDEATFVAELVAVVKGYLSQPCGDGASNPSH